MSNNRIKPLLVFFVAITATSTLFSQKIDSSLQILANDFQQEKIHIHYDKSMYNKGETIWFKAYILAENEPSDISKNMYFDVYDNENKLLKHIATPVFEASARGQFIVPENYKYYTIHIKAYTKWMLNFDKQFLYHKAIEIYQPNIKNNGIKKPETMVNFFVEGGNFVVGILSNIAFKATTKQGMPAAIKGVIKLGNEVIDSIKTLHDGMGNFNLIAQATTDTFFAYWKDEFGNEGKTMLPIATQSGIALQAFVHKEKLMIQVQRSDSLLDENFTTLHIIAHINQQPIATAKINLQNQTSALTQIPINTAPTGIVTISLFNKNWLPIAERIVFVNNHNYSFNTNTIHVIKGFKKREKNEIEITIPDSSWSNLSVAVTDAEVSANKDFNIFSSLLLTSDIKGYVHEPAYYFNSKNDSAAKFLDLVMLTNGWRKIKWQELLSNKFPTINYPQEKTNMNIAGSIVTATKNERLMTSQQILLMLQPSDKGKTQSLILKVNNDKTFVQNNVIFYDTLKVFYKILGNENLANVAEVAVTNNLLKANYSLHLSENELQNNYWKIDTAWLLQQQKIFAEQEKLSKLLKETTLQEVIVKTKVKKQVDVLDEKYTSGLFAGNGDNYQFDVMNDSRGQSSINVFNYLQGMVAGLQVYQNQGETLLKWRGKETVIYLDEFESQPDQLYSLSMSDVAYIKVFKPPFFGATGGGSGGAISIYTRKGNDVNLKNKTTGISYKILEGYTSYKEFYMPDYSTPQSTSADLRTTLYWNPFVLTDNTNHQQKISFYNNDFSKKFRIVIEGINSNGKLTHYEKIME